jgi:hypothetical protein
VLGILRNYHGQPFIHRLCKEIVRSIPADSPLRTEVAVALETTGVVSGEFGMAEAYERKRLEVLDWLKDSDERVQNSRSGTSRTWSACAMLKGNGPNAHRTGPTVARRNGPSSCAVALECAVIGRSV